MAFGRCEVAVEVARPEQAFAVRDIARLPPGLVEVDAP